MHRNRLFHSLGIISMSALLLSCGKPAGRPLLAIDGLPPAEEIVFTQWHVLGPFFYEQQDDEAITQAQAVKRLYGDDLLSRFGMAESDASYAGFSAIKSGADFISETADAEGHVLDLGKMLQVDRPAVAYAGREIDAPAAQDVALVAQMRGMGLKMWLNNKLVIEQDGEGFAHRLDRVKPVHLNKGKNLLLAKVVSNEKAFRLIASLMTMPLAREKARQYGKNPVVKRNIIGNEDDLELDLPLENLDAIRQVDILNGQNNPLDRQRYRLKADGKIAFESPSPGLYHCRVGVVPDDFETAFYRGDVESAFAAYKERAAAFSSDERARINLEALLIRYEHLLAPENKQPNKTEWQAKVVYVIEELETILRDLESGSEAFQDRPGRHLRGFQSRIDDQTEHYMIYVPPQYAETREPIPLVVFLPYAQSPQRPFLKSVFVASTELIENFTRAADRDGYAVLWTNGSGTWGGSSLNQKGMTDILETISAVEHDYAIDRDRVYLWGSCAGARDALMLAARYPDQFAAIGLLGALSETYNMERGDRMTKGYAAEWLRANSPVYCVENLSHVPIYAVAAEHDDHTPIEEATKLMEKCRDLGMQASLDIMPYAYEYYYPEEPTAKILEFYKDKAKEHGPAQVQLSTWQLKYGSAYWVKINGLVQTMKRASIRAAIDDRNTVTVATENVRAYEIKLADLPYQSDLPLTVVTDGRVSYSGVPREAVLVIDATARSEQARALSKNANVEGPISHALTDGFIVVEGTQGALEDRRKAGAVCDAFCQAWREDYFQDCLHKKDVEVTGQDIAGKNLVLFGNDRTNSIIKKVIGQIPLKFSTSGIQVGDRAYQGTNLGVRMVYPNPLNQGKYIVIIGGNDMTNLPFEEKCLAIEGWYDFMLWKPGEVDKSLVAIGYFDQSWKRILSLT